MHLGPLEGSKNGEYVFNYRYDITEEGIWEEPSPDEPLSLVDKVGVTFI